MNKIAPSREPGFAIVARLETRSRECRPIRYLVHSLHGTRAISLPFRRMRQWPRLFLPTSKQGFSDDVDAALFFAITRRPVRLEDLARP
jgi:hypothetical protein